MNGNWKDPTFSDSTTLEELQNFCDSLECPNYLYSDVLKLHAYYISKKEIFFENAPHFLSESELKKQDEEFIKTAKLQLNSKRKYLDSENETFDEIFDLSDDQTEEEESQQSKSSQKEETSHENSQSNSNQNRWSDEEVEFLIKCVNEVGKRWQKILNMYPKAFKNRKAEHLRRKVLRLKKDPKYASRIKV
ncbi:hypothetical protein TRFO_16113 [Tritrichomonas foetus]|uniref:Uncharacterized protein n=1 Tax=Tritrichomonas foetus TaxID=1144522 RepID=A0A1J4KQY9_9EUKA|nr:hypothetical protein TRFO_16113 [Tritrichomonas foetus]|eukprot:OHT13679.1 hypothetical protein TRFO_16113 [Tritrichomonas foetus]